MYLGGTFRGPKVKVRIQQTPGEKEIDGVRLDNFEAGTVRVVSPSVGAWLIAQGYAELEMRSQPTTEDKQLVGLSDQFDIAADRRRGKKDQL